MDVEKPQPLHDGENLLDTPATSAAQPQLSLRDFLLNTATIQRQLDQLQHLSEAIRPHIITQFREELSMCKQENEALQSIITTNAQPANQVPDVDPNWVMVNPGLVKEEEKRTAAAKATATAAAAPAPPRQYSALQRESDLQARESLLITAATLNGSQFATGHRCGPEEIPGAWSCLDCTYPNYPDRAVCDILCGLNKAYATLYSSPFAIAHRLEPWEPACICEFNKAYATLYSSPFAIGHRLEPWEPACICEFNKAYAALDSSQYAIGHQRGPEELPGAWSCPNCTYLNYPDRAVCAMCGLNKAYESQLGFSNVGVKEEKKPTAASKATAAAAPAPPRQHSSPHEESDRQAGMPSLICPSGAPLSAATLDSSQFATGHRRGPEEIPRAWSCPDCTYLNCPDRTVCDMCGFNKA